MTRKVDQRFAALHARFGPALRRLALGYARDAADAEDLLQEIWFGIWRALPRFRGECSDRTWVYRIGHNRGLTHRARRSALLLTTSERIGEVPDAGPAPDEAADRSLRLDRVLESVRRLRPGLREVMILSLEGLGARDIAEVTGLTEGNVNVRLHRARAELRSRLSEKGGG